MERSDIESEITLCIERASSSALTFHQNIWFKGAGYLRWCRKMNLKLFLYTAKLQVTAGPGFCQIYRWTVGCIMYIHVQTNIPIWYHKVVDHVYGCQYTLWRHNKAVGDLLPQSHIINTAEVNLFVLYSRPIIRDHSGYRRSTTRNTSRPWLRMQC